MPKSPANSRKERSDFLAKQKMEFRHARAGETDGRRLFVKNFPLTTTEKQLIDFFQQFGEIENAKLIKDANGASKGFGFVCFKTKESAQQAIKESTLRKFPESNQPLYVNLFETKETHLRNAQKKRRPVPQVPAQYPLTPEMQQMQPQPFIHQNYPPSSKEALKRRLQDKGISGKALKDILIQISEDQAKRLADNEELMERFLQQV